MATDGAGVFAEEASSAAPAAIKPLTDEEVKTFIFDPPCHPLPAEHVDAIIDASVELLAKESKERAKAFTRRGIEQVLRNEKRYIEALDSKASPKAVERLRAIKSATYIAEGGPPGWYCLAEGRYFSKAAEEIHMRLKNGETLSNDAGDVFWAKPGKCFSYARAEAFARAKARELNAKLRKETPPDQAPDEKVGRLLTVSEMREVLQEHGPLVPDDDQWTACVSEDRADGIEYVQTGDYYWRPGYLQVENLSNGSQPHQTTEPDRKVSKFGVAPWITLVAWTFRDLPGANDDDEEEMEDTQTIARGAVEATSAREDETIEHLKAKTMHNMVEEFDVSGVAKKLIFLTNRQADLISKGTPYRTRSLNFR